MNEPDYEKLKNKLLIEIGFLYKKYLNDGLYCHDALIVFVDVLFKFIEQCFIQLKNEGINDELYRFKKVFKIFLNDIFDEI